MRQTVHRCISFALTGWRVGTPADELPTSSDRPAAAAAAFITHSQFSLLENIMTVKQHAETGSISASKDKRSSPPKDHNLRNEEADDRLRLLIERIERLEEEKKGVGDDIKDVYGEAKATGYDPKIMCQIVRLRKMKPDDRREMEAVLATYKNALGMEDQGSLF